MGQQRDQNGPEELIERLSHADPEVRAAAADRLRWIRPSAVGAVPELVKLLADQSGKVRVAAIFALRSIDPTNEAFTRLTDLLEDSHSAEVDFLRWLSRELEPDDDGKVELVLALLELQLGQDLLDSHNLIIKSIVSIGPAAILPLIGFLFSDDDCVVRCACHALAEFGPGAAAAIADLTQLLYSNDANSQEAARTLGKIGPAAKSAVPVLVALLERNTGSGLLVEALGEIGSDAAASLPLLIRELLEYVDDDDAQEFVAGIAWTLNSIGLEALTHFKPAVIQATPLLIDKLMSCEASNPYWESTPIIEAVSAILRIGTEHAAPHLVKVWLGDEYPKNRYAASLLVEIGSPVVQVLLAQAASCFDPMLQEKVEDLIEGMGEKARPALMDAADASGSAVALLAHRLLRSLEEEAQAEALAERELSRAFADNRSSGLPVSAEDERILTLFKDVDLTKHLTRLQVFWCIGQVDRAAFESAGRAIGWDKLQRTLKRHQPTFTQIRLPTSSGYIRHQCLEVLDGLFDREPFYSNAWSDEERGMALRDEYKYKNRKESCWTRKSRTALRYVERFLFIKGLQPEMTVGEGGIEAIKLTSQQ